MWRHLTGWEITDVSKDTSDFILNGRNVYVIVSDTTSHKTEYLNCTSATTKRQWTRTGIWTHDLDRDITDGIVLRWLVFTVTLMEKFAVRLFVGMIAYAIRCYVILRSSIFSDFDIRNLFARSRILANRTEHALVKHTFVRLFRRLLWKQIIPSNRATSFEVQTLVCKSLFIFSSL
jgi:hypothetical protein